MIEFQYFDGCPNARESLENLREVQKELGIGDKEISIVEIPGIESAESMSFQGSPSILIDGIDIYSGTRPMGFNYSCRVYSFEGKQTGIIPKSFIGEKIRNARPSQRRG
jgi:hypothetical protein